MALDSKKQLYLHLDGTRVRERAYFLWLDRGRPLPGDPLKDWFQAVGTEFALQVDAAVGRYVAAVLIFERGQTNSAANCKWNGTCGFVDTGERKIVTTAYHVWKRAEERDLLGPTYDFLIAGGRSLQQGGRGSPIFRMREFSLIDHHERLDLAVLSPPDWFDPADINKEWCRCETWPPRRGVPGEVGLFIGYPGEFRTPVPQGIHLKGIGFFDYVSSSSDLQVILVDEYEEREAFEVLKGCSPLKSVGGVSGSTVFVQDGTAYYPIAVIYEGGGAVDARIFARHLDLIRADGMIDRSKVWFSNDEK